MNVRFPESSRSREASQGRALRLLMAESSRSLTVNMGSTPEMARVFFTFRDDPESLNEDEFLQGRTLLSATVRHLENLYLQHEAGMLSDEAWATREALIRNIVLSPGFDRLMSSSTGQNYGGPFIDYAERIRNESKDGAGN